MEISNVHDKEIINRDETRLHQHSQKKICEINESAKSINYQHVSKLIKFYSSEY